MTKIRNIYLDMDQVLCDWIGGVGKLYGSPKLYWEWSDRSKMNGDSNRLEDLIHEPLVEIKEKIDAGGAEFWADLEILPWAKHLYDELVKIGPVTIISSAGGYKYAKEGKSTWLRKNLDHKGPVVFCGPGEKYQYVGDGILIDDYEKTIKQVNNAGAGGVGILFPSPCNSFVEIPSDALLSTIIDKVVSGLDDLDNRSFRVLSDAEINIRGKRV